MCRLSRSKPPGRRGLFNSARTIWIAEDREVAQLACEIMVWERHMERECQRLVRSGDVDAGPDETIADAAHLLTLKGRTYPPRVIAWRKIHGISPLDNPPAASDFSPVWKAATPSRERPEARLSSPLPAPLHRPRTAP